MIGILRNFCSPIDAIQKGRFWVPQPQYDTQLSGLANEATVGFHPSLIKKPQNPE